MIIQCPSCESELRIADDKRGKRIDCPKCQYGFKVDSSLIRKKPPPLEEDAVVFVDADEEEDLESDRPRKPRRQPDDGKRRSEQIRQEGRRGQETRGERDAIRGERGTEIRADRPTKGQPIERGLTDDGDGDAEEPDRDRPRKRRRTEPEDDDTDTDDLDERPRQPRTDDLDDEDDDEERLRTKKKKKKKKAASPWLKIGLIAGGGVLALGLMIGAAVMILSGPGPAQPITKWEKYTTSEQGEFGFEYPADWRERSYGIKDHREVDITGAGASINIKESLVGSLLGDIARASNRGGKVDDDNLPVAKVHDMRKPDIKGYEEKPAETVTTRYGKARRSAYAQGNKRGYRVTLLLPQTSLDIYCECRASDWAVLRPAFERFISSIGPGLPP